MVPTLPYIRTLTIQLFEYGSNTPLYSNSPFLFISTVHTHICGPLPPAHHIHRYHYLSHHIHEYNRIPISTTLELISKLVFYLNVDSGRLGQYASSLSSEMYGTIISTSLVSAAAFFTTLFSMYSGLL